MLKSVLEILVLVLVLDEVEVEVEEIGGMVNRDVPIFLVCSLLDE